MPQPLPPPGEFTAEPPRPKISGRWYILPAVLALAAVSVFVLGVALLYTSVSDGFDEIRNNSRFTYDTDAPGIYARSDISTVRCTLRTDNGTVIALEPASGDVRIDINGTDYYKIATVPEDVVAGTYTISCPGAGPILSTGPEFDLGLVVTGILLLVIVPGALGFLAFVSLIIIVVKRHV